MFDSFYDNYRGVIAMFRVVDGSISKGAEASVCVCRKASIPEDGRGLVAAPHATGQKIRFKNSGKEFLVEDHG